MTVNLRSIAPKTLAALALFAQLFLFTGCTTITIDEYRTESAKVETGESVVLLGRRHSSDYETEPDLVECIGEVLQDVKIKVIPEQEFLDSLYPWFEPRTAPMSLRRLEKLLENQTIANRLAQYNISYLVWVDGQTETTRSTGSITCAITAGGGGCFGFGTWDDESDYEASIWDFETRNLLGKISADASGTSYMPAVVVPIPMIARVQASACAGLGQQLRSMLQSGDTP